MSDEEISRTADRLARRMGAEFVPYSMTSEGSKVTETVSQRAREAVHEFCDHALRNVPEDALCAISYGDILDHFTRFEREISADKDETIARLREALERARKSFQGVELACWHGASNANISGLAANADERARAALAATEKMD